jgi:hypothetical protein
LHSNENVVYMNVNNNKVPFTGDFEMQIFTFGIDDFRIFVIFFLNFGKEDTKIKTVAYLSKVSGNCYNNIWDIPLEIRHGLRLMVPDFLGFFLCYRVRLGFSD